MPFMQSIDIAEGRRGSISRAFNRQAVSSRNTVNYSGVGLLGHYALDGIGDGLAHIWGGVGSSRGVACRYFSFAARSTRPRSMMAR